MKKILNLRVFLAIFLAAAPLAATAQTTFFTDNFNNGSTTNGPSIRGGSSTASYTSYDIASAKTAVGPTTIVPGDFTLKLSTATTSGYLEAQALFTNNAVSLTTVGDYIDITVVFTNTGGTLLAGGTKAALWIGLYNSDGSAPVSGGLLGTGVAPNQLNTTAGSAYAAGNCANWQGYAAELTSGGTDRTVTRPLQNGSGTTSANQELLGNNASGGTFVNPGGATIDTGPVTTIPLTSGAQYTLELKLILSGPNVLTISNSLYNGVGTSGTVLFSQGSTNISGATYLTAAFDGFAIGSFNSGTSFNPTMDITSILITGQSTPITTPPSITSEPQPVIVATNGSCAFTVSATGFGLGYQWHRNGTNLIDGGNISGSTSSQLVISPATNADVFSGANGYYVTVSGTGGYSTNSVTNSLVLINSTNLIWTDNNPNNIWDVNNTVNWQDTNSNPSVFNFGDPVTFDDTGAGGTVALTGSYLSAASVMVDSESGYVYSFTGSGGFAGPGSLIYKGPGQLTLNNINTYSGGTIISNANALLYLQNYGGLGTGPVTLAKAGGKMEIVSTGSASSGINGNIIVADDFSIQVDGVGTYATVFFGDFSGVSGKTLTFNPKDLTTTNRFRAYGVNTIYNANMVLNGPATSQANYNGSVLAPYNASGTQTYNGIISGNGGIVERGNGTTILNGPNTYSGGTTPTTGNIGFGIDTVGAVTSGPIGTGPLYLSPEIPSATGSGTVFASGGAHTIANPIQYPSATNNLTLIIGGTNDLTFTGPVTLNGIDSLGSMTNRTLQVTNTGLTTISGVISDGGAGFELIKTGAGTLALNNTETYTGSTTNSAGMLLINGSLAAASALTVSTNATLAGTGTINGTVLVNAGGILAAGTNTIGTIGTLTINNNLTLLGNVFIKVNRFVSPSNDVISVSQVLTNAGVGTLTVTNLGPTIVAGNRFTLFNKALTNGFALTVTGGGISWSNRLGIDGSILALGPSVATNPTNILFSIIGGTNLALSWPADHLGWYLQVQTNALSIGLQTNSSLWFDVPNSSNVDSTNILINPKNPTVFYRLSLQP